MTPNGRDGLRTPVDEALLSVRPAVRTALIFGLFINLLLFVSPLYMLQIYDRAIPSRSGVTLAGLTILALVLTAVYAALDLLRSRVMAEAGRRALAAAEVVVEEDPSNPGYYQSKFFLRPHYQLEGLTVSLRLVSKLPSAKAG